MSPCGPFKSITLLLFISPFLDPWVLSLHYSYLFLPKWILTYSCLTHISHPQSRLFYYNLSCLKAKWNFYNALYLWTISLYIIVW